MYSYTVKDIENLLKIAFKNTVLSIMKCKAEVISYGYKICRGKWLKIEHGILSILPNGNLHTQ